MSEHTKTPWHVDSVDPAFVSVRVNAIANAAYIVRAVNAHEALVEALEGIIHIGKRDMTNPKYDGYFAAAHSALALARGEEVAP
jgi:hypothetical protein